MNPQPGLLAGANQQENVCAHARQTAPSHLPRHAKGKGRAEGGDSMRRREGGEPPSCTVKIDSKRSDVLKKRNKGLETSALVILLE